MAKQYKRYKWAQYICFALSILCCLVPAVVAAFKISPVIKTTESKLALGGVAVVIVAIIALVVCRSLIRKYISKLPYTLTVLIAIGSILLIVIGLEKIIDDAKAILLVGLIGAAAGFVFELISMYCKSMARDIKDEFIRRKAE
mgnify:FL=1